MEWTSLHSRWGTDMGRIVAQRTHPPVPPFNPDTSPLLRCGFRDRLLVLAAADPFQETVTLPPSPPQQVLLPWVLMLGRTRGWPGRWAWQGMRATGPGSEVSFAISSSWLTLSADLQRMFWKSGPWFCLNFAPGFFSPLPRCPCSATSPLQLPPRHLTQALGPAVAACPEPRLHL